MADSLSTGEMGRGFGLLRAMDSFGAFGSLLAGMLVIFLLQGNRLALEARTFRVLVALATIPGLLSVLAIVLLVREVPARRRTGLDLEARAGLPRVFLLYTAVTALFTLGNSSDAFVILRAQGLGGTTLVVVALMTGFN